ncbi:MAG: hypothetical protein ACRDBG_08540, partial [Waterburya sp.]
NKRESLGSNREQITRLNNEIDATITLNGFATTHDTKDYHLTWFNAVRGSLLTFDFADLQCRMDDSLTIKSLPYDKCKKFELAPLKLESKGDKEGELGFDVGTPGTFRCPTLASGGYITVTTQINPQSNADPKVVEQNTWQGHNTTLTTTPSYTVTDRFIQSNQLLSHNIFCGITSNVPVNVSDHWNAVAQFIGDDSSLYVVFQGKGSVSGFGDINNRLSVLRYESNKCEFTNVSNGVINTIYANISHQTSCTVPLNSYNHSPCRVFAGRDSGNELWFRLLSGANGTPIGFARLRVDAAGQLILDEININTYSTAMASGGNRVLNRLPFMYDGIYYYTEDLGLGTVQSTTTFSMRYTVEPNIRVNNHFSWYWANRFPYNAFSTILTVVDNNVFPVNNNAVDHAIDGERLNTSTTYIPMRVVSNRNNISITTGSFMRVFISTQLNPLVPANATTVSSIPVTLDSYSNIVTHVMPNSDYTMTFFGVSLHNSGNATPYGSQFGFKISSKSLPNDIQEQYVFNSTSYPSGTDFMQNLVPRTNVNRHIFHHTTKYYPSLNMNTNGDAIGVIPESGDVIFKRAYTKMFVALPSTQDVGFNSNSKIKVIPSYQEDYNAFVTVVCSDGDTKPYVRFTSIS